jgi:uncharacterized protein YabE (DUF348 family)
MDKIDDLFKFQCIASRTYDELDDISREFLKNGLKITVSRAFFLGLVVGKREERKRNQNRLRRIEN